MSRRAMTAAMLAAVLATMLAGALARGPAPGSSPGATAASASPTPARTRASHGAVVGRLMALQRAYNAGDVQRLCRPGDLLDRAALAQLHEPGVPGCEADVERLLRSPGDMAITVEAVHRRPDLATAIVRLRGAGAVPVDLVRRGGRWLVSLSAGGDPLQALTGT